MKIETEQIYKIVKIHGGVLTDDRHFMDDVDQLLKTAHNSDYAKCTNEVFKYVTDNICDDGITKKEIRAILKKHFA